MTTILFFVSLTAIVSMIVLKMVERRFAKVIFLSNIFSKGDGFIRDLIDACVFKYNRYKKITNIFIFEFMPSFLYELLVKMKDWVSKKYYSAGSRFQGRRVLRSNGSVSFFLEQLAEDRSVEKKM